LNGPEIVYRFLSGLDPAALSGTLRVVPVANPLAYAAVSRFTPVDGMNLNRVIPGATDGTLTERLAAVLASRLLDGLDVYVDVHSGGAFPTVDYAYILNAEALSRASGFGVLYRPSAGLAGTSYEGTTSSYTQSRGTASVVLEIGGGAVDQADYVDRGVRAITNILRAQGVLAGTPAPPPRQTVVRRIVILRPAAAGLLLPETTELGRIVPMGHLLGRVVSPYTLETLEEIRSPLEAGLVILAHLRANKVDPGDYGYMVGDMASAEA
jgi:predicted deacylase